MKLMASRIDVTVFYLEMRSPPARAVPAPRNGLAVAQAKTPTISFYRFLYDQVGREWNWHSRRKLSDEQLSEIIHDPLDEVHVVSVDGTPAGFAELDRRTANDIEMVQFGLTSEFIGQGIGPWFLQWVIDYVWSFQPDRFWLHTCTQDHPAALRKYKEAGFIEYHREDTQHEIV